ncbi:MAG: DegV family EDD domain-containing protein [Gemmatimonadota bacterium]|nr:MAG: DegV family EDD domain-containing protein [Gemmatimonadota bacterium]
MFAHRAELDRINVFPVPDGDTGTNLALTLRAMAEAISGLDHPSVSGVALRLAEAGVLGARGNSGMMLSHYFIGFADGLDGQARAGPRDLTIAMRRASDSLYQAVDKPVEGTILTVVRESTEEIERFAGHIRDLETFAGELLRAAKASLARTPQLLPALAEAGVVDAGAKGFVRFLEGMVGLVRGKTTASRIVPDIASEKEDLRDAAAEAAFPENGDRDFRYCAEFVVRGDDLPERPTLTAAVRGLGASLIVNRAASLAKIHIHTNDPAKVESALAGLAVAVDCVKAEDMRAQHRRLRRDAERRVAVVTDSTCDLPGELLVEHDITVVPLTVMFGEEAFLDQLEITHAEFAERLTDPSGPQPKTSQPSPAQFDAAFTRGAENAGHVLGVFLSGALSGTLGQARTAARRFEAATVAIHDSRTASLGLGLRVLRAAELAREGWNTEEIVSELERLRARSGLFLTVDNLTYLQKSGRVAKARAYLANLLDLKPILSVDDSGTVIPVDKVRHRDALVPRVLELLNEEIPAKRNRLRMGVAHVLCEDVARELAAALRREFEPEEVLIRPATGVLSVHTGPGAWAVFYQAE